MACETPLKFGLNLPNIGRNQFEFGRSWPESEVGRLVGTGPDLVEIYQYCIDAGPTSFKSAQAWSKPCSLEPSSKLLETSPNLVATTPQPARRHRLIGISPSFADCGPNWIATPQFGQSQPHFGRSQIVFGRTQRNFGLTQPKFAQLVKHVGRTQRSSLGEPSPTWPELDPTLGETRRKQLVQRSQICHQELLRLTACVRATSPYPDPPSPTQKRNKNKRSDLAESSDLVEHHAQFCRIQARFGRTSSNFGRVRLGFGQIRAMFGRNQPKLR